MAECKRSDIRRYRLYGKYSLRSRQLCDEDDELAKAFLYSELALQDPGSTARTVLFRANQKRTAGCRCTILSNEAPPTVLLTTSTLTTRYPCRPYERTLNGTIPKEAVNIGASRCIISTASQQPEERFGGMACKI